MQTFLLLAPNFGFLLAPEALPQKAFSFTPGFSPVERYLLSGGDPHNGSAAPLDSGQRENAT